jgi:hypothetical protein
MDRRLLSGNIIEPVHRNTSRKKEKNDKAPYTVKISPNLSVLLFRELTTTKEPMLSGRVLPTVIGMLTNRIPSSRRVVAKQSPRRRKIRSEASRFVRFRLQKSSVVPQRVRPSSVVHGDPISMNGVSR